MSKPGTRPEFDAIAAGWGGDDLADLEARCQLMAEWWTVNGLLTDAELKIARAMRLRLMALGGIAPEIKQ